MSTLQDTVRQRRSIRKFKDHPIPESIILQVLDAGRWAPSIGNAQPWRMILVSDVNAKSNLLKIAERNLREEMRINGPLEGKIEYIDKVFEMLSSAPILIVACMTKEFFSESSDRWLSEHVMGVQSVAVSIQNMLLVAFDLGLGGCWCSAPLLVPAAIRRSLGIPQSVEPQAFIALGYADEAPEPSKRKPIKEFVYLNRWGNTYSL
jgi:F420 biosynthesis protein FbiB-like protein